MKLAAFAALAAGLVVAGSASATPYVVDAYANSSSGGTGVATLALTSGDLFAVNVGVTDLWSAGALPRWSNANGLTGDTYATGTDESGESLGTHIGANFGTWSQFSLSAPYGTLVGELGGVYQALGTSFSGAAWGTGTLNLYYWDSNFGDNTGSITANVVKGGVKGGAVPEPATWALMIGGFGLAGAALRRRRATATA